MGDSVVTKVTIRYGVARQTGKRGGNEGEGREQVNNKNGWQRLCGRKEESEVQDNGESLEVKCPWWRVVAFMWWYVPFGQGQVKSKS